MSAERSEYVMRTYLERVVGGGELELLADIAADDLVQDPDVWGPGRKGLERHVRWFRSAVADPVVVIDRLVAGDDAVVAHWTGTGTHAAEFFGVAPTGRPVTSTATSWFTLRDGRIATYHVTADRHAILTSLGVLPA
jgi:ketosteroid isomerase-like protein